MQIWKSYAPKLVVYYLILKVRTLVFIISESCGSAIGSFVKDSAFSMPANCKNITACVNSMFAIGSFVKDNSCSIPANGKSITANANSVFTIGSFVKDGACSMFANGKSVTAHVHTMAVIGSFDTDGGYIVLILTFSNFEF